MRILIVTPVPPTSRQGNRVTATRWMRLLRELGHSVTITQQFARQRCDLLIALHARRSAGSIRKFHDQRPQSPLIVALTGTDLYHDIHHSDAAVHSLKLATCLVMLQSDGIHSLPPAVRSKSRVIYQSVRPMKKYPLPIAKHWEVAVVGHLRPVKDPFRAAMAARRLPASSRIRIVQIGAALSPSMKRRARKEMAVNARYVWLGEVPHWKAQQRLARSRLMVLTSKLEGGANVVGEALAASVPVLSSRISGSIGILGAQYPGYFGVGDTRGLTELMCRAESDAQFYERLRDWCMDLAPLVEPGRERQSWCDLLRELDGSSAVSARPPKS